MSRIVMLTVMLTAGHAAAGQCGDRESMVGFLAEQWAEARHVMGLISDKAMMELYASAAGTWTIVVTLADGTSCVLASGDHLETIRNLVLPGIPG